MRRTMILLYGIAAYLIAMSSIVYAIGFVGNLWVPKSIDDGAAVPVTQAVVIDLLLIGLFAVQHSAMARRGFKARWPDALPQAMERSTYVLASALVLWLLFWQWRPIGDVIWNVEDPMGAAALYAVFFLGWIIVTASTFLIDHAELFGLKQVAGNWLGRSVEAHEFRMPLLYKVVRHPIYFGFLLAFWATPLMTAGHLLFAFAMTTYILVGIKFEERDLVATFGDAYRRYRDSVSMLLPWPPRKP